MSNETENIPNHFPGVDDPGLPSTGYILTNVALVFIMTPALGFFYAGMSKSKNALSLLMLSFQCIIIVTMQWFLFGFSLAFSETGNSFIGDFNHGALNNIGATALSIATAVPGVAFCLYQMQFAVVTPAIIFGSVAERVRIVPAMVFIFVWTTLVYDVVTYWTWSSNGWLRNMSCLDTLDCGNGAYDFAGGGPIHIASGFAGLAYCLVVGKRKDGMRVVKPHNLANVVLGTGLLWFGWFGFNGGSAVASTPRAAMAAAATTIAAAFSGFTWAMFDYIVTKKISAISVCSGIVAGLVSVTPASGFVAPWAGAVIGIISGIVVNLSSRCKNYFVYDDTLDAFGLHGVGGIVGGIMTGLHQKSIAMLDGIETEGGAMDGNWTKVGQQIAACLSIAAWSFFMSYVILTILNKIPGLHLRVTAEEELAGQDSSETGEVAYEFQPMGAHSERTEVLTTNKSL